MRGLNTHTTRRQHLADGGIVTSLKRMVGMDPERNARVEAYRQQAAAEKAAAASAAAPASAPAPAKAITDYNSGGALKRREAAAGLANGGMVRGPGTGTSDDVPDEMREGGYVLPADTTKTVGPQTIAMLDQLQAKAGGPRGMRGAKVPVQLSDGEYKLTPEQVHALGVKTLDDVKNATHTPVAEAGTDDTRMFFANGGAVEDEQAERLRRQTAMYVQGAQAAAAAQPPAPPPAPVAPVVQPTAAPGRFDGTRAVVAGAADDARTAMAAGNPAAAAGAVVRGAVTAPVTAVGEAAYGAVAPVARGLASFYNGVTGNVQPAAPAAAPAQAVAVTPTAPVAAPVPVPAAAVPAAAQAPAIDGTRPAGMPVQGAPVATAPAAPAVYRVGNSFSDTQEGAAAGAGPRGLPSAQNIAAADALAARSGADSTARVAAAAAPQPAGISAPTVRRLTSHELRNLEVSASSITNNGGRFDPTKGNNVAQTAYKAALANDAAAQTGQVSLDGEAMRQNGTLQREGIQQAGGIAREGIQQAGANTRSARGLSVDREKLGIEGRRADAEIAGRNVETAGAQQLQNLRNTLTDPKATPAQREQATKALQALSNRAPAANRLTVVPGGQEWDPQANAMRNVPGRVFDNETRQEIPPSGAQGAQAAQPRTVGQVFTDANGKKAKWDGQKFVPI